MRLTLLKLKESEEEKEKGEILSVVGGIEKEFAEIEQLSFGENFSPARAKGFSIASIAIFAGLKEMEGLDEKGEMVEMHKAKVRDRSALPLSLKLMSQVFGVSLGLLQ